MYRSRRRGRLLHRVPETEGGSSSLGLFICLSTGREEKGVSVSHVSTKNNSQIGKEGENERGEMRGRGSLAQILNVWVNRKEPQAGIDG